MSLTVLWILAVPGCMTIVSQAGYWTGFQAADSNIPDPTAVVYGGTRISAPSFWGILTRWDRSGQTGLRVAGVVFYLIDTSLCLIADTLLLPLTLSEAWWLHAHEDEEKASDESDRQHLREAAPEPTP